MAALRSAASSSFRSATARSNVAVAGAGRRAPAGATMSFKPSHSASRGFSTSRIAREEKGPVDGSVSSDKAHRHLSFAYADVIPFCSLLFPILSRLLAPTRSRLVNAHEPHSPLWRHHHRRTSSSRFPLHGPRL